MKNMLSFGVQGQSPWDGVAVIASRRRGNLSFFSFLLAISISIISLSLQAQEATRASFNRAVKQAAPAVVNVLTAKLVVEKPMLVADPMLQMLIKTPARAKVER
ncbi:MAG: hypothetical protein EBR79_04495, partial [Proteobacteria bacterium]|nr:hypothetical protein [Pseudomonadota bacterium]